LADDLRIGWMLSSWRRDRLLQGLGSYSCEGRNEAPTGRCGVRWANPRLRYRSGSAVRCTTERVQAGASERRGVQVVEGTQRRRLSVPTVHRANERCRSAWPSCGADEVGSAHRCVRTRSLHRLRGMSPAALHHRRVAVGTPVTRRPPHRSGRAALPHPAPTSGSHETPPGVIGTADAGRWQPPGDQSQHASPRYPPSMASAVQYSPPQGANRSTEAR